MKKQIILLFFLFSYSFAWSQQFVKTTTPCNEELLKNTPGLWINPANRVNAKISKQQQQEIFNRLDKIHQFVFDIYPSPLGIDAVWYRFTTDGDFAQQIRIDHFPGGKTNESFVNGIPVVSYSYTANFYGYGCGRNKYEIMRGYPGEGGATVEVFANYLNGFLLNDYGGVEGMQIDGRKIRRMPTVKGKWKGYTLYQTEAGSGISMVLLHREGMLQYIPVTRKQYLDLSISYLNKFYDKQIAAMVQSEKQLADMGEKPDPSAKEKFEKQKKDVLKHYQDALAATTAAGLLDAPAIIPAAMGYASTALPVFTAETTGGRMLVTENPAYFRKDLPKYIPQLFVLLLEKVDWPFSPKQDPIKLMEEYFPIEKLQAMIDK